MKMYSNMIGNPIAERFSEGGVFIMTTILICFLVSVYFAIRGLMCIRKDDKAFTKFINLIAESSLLGLVLGVFGALLGLISGFDAVDNIENTSVSAFAGGLKTSFLSLLFGSLTFIVSRIGIIVLKLLKR